MKICPNCQTQNEDNAQYCSFCHYSFQSVILYSPPNQAYADQNQQEQGLGNQNQANSPYPPFSQNNYYGNYQGQPYYPQYPPYGNQNFAGMGYPNSGPQNPYGNTYQGNIPQPNQPYNQNFGYQNQTTNNSSNNPKVITVVPKKKKNKGFIFIGIALLAITLAVVGFFILKPTLFVTVSELCAQGNYVKAFQKANDEEKPIVEAENAIAYLSGQEADTFFNKSSFVLRDAWYEISENKDGSIHRSAVLHLQGTNRYGGVTSSHSYWTFDNEDNEWSFFANITDWDEEEYSKYDDTAEMAEKLVNNMARTIMKSIMIDSNKLPKSSIKNINNLFEQDILDEVVLLKETYHTSNQ